MSFIIKESFQTKNLILREVNKKDKAQLTRFINFNDMDALKWLMPHKVKGVKSLSEDDALLLINFYKKISNRGHRKSIQILHIYRKHSNEIIGLCNIYRDMQNSPRVATYIIPEHRRKGYGAEAHFGTLQRICRQDHSIRMMFSQVEGWNKASQRKMIKNGFTRLGSRVFSSPGTTSPQPWVTFARKPIKFKGHKPC